MSDAQSFALAFGVVVGGVALYALRLALLARRLSR